MVLSPLIHWIFIFFLKSRVTVITNFTFASQFGSQSQNIQRHAIQLPLPIRPEKISGTRKYWNWWSFFLSRENRSKHIISPVRTVVLKFLLRRGHSLIGPNIILRTLEMWRGVRGTIYTTLGSDENSLMKQSTRPRL